MLCLGHKINCLFVLYIFLESSFPFEIFRLSYTNSEVVKPILLFHAFPPLSIWLLHSTHLASGFCTAPTFSSFSLDSWFIDSGFHLCGHTLQ